MSDAISPDERSRVVTLWNRTQRALPEPALVDILFSERAARHPDAIALMMGQKTMTYGELDARSSLLAERLRAAGACRGEMVGIAATRSFELIVGLLAILKVGGAYVPLDGAHPAERLAFLVDETRLRFALDPNQELALPPAVRSIGSGAGDETTAPGARAATPLGERSAMDAAYVLFTSGSTGKPKGVVVEHRAVVRLVRETDFASFEGAVGLMLAPIAFDASTFEIWGPLLNGGRLAMAPPGVLGPSDIAQIFRRDGVTWTCLTTALFRQMVDLELESLSGLAQIITGGEAGSAPHFERLVRAHPNVDVVHAYGPTENTGASTRISVREVVEGKTPPIGRPISNSTAYVLDESMEPVGVGVAGELYTGGLGVARGYLNRPELTAERFVPDPFADSPGARMYRTGDVVRWLEEGTIEFVGRIDHQVKIRGFRIEPGEIEATLAEVPSVRESMIVLREDVPGDKRLVGYVVWSGAPAIEEARAHLGAKLPEYMIPSTFVTLERFPLNANGKVDRQALPVPDYSSGSQEYVAPRNETEKILTAIYAAVLGVERVGIHDDFFDLGGQSLLAARVAWSLEQMFGAKVDLKVVFDESTPAMLAAYLESVGISSGAETAEHEGR